MEFRPLPTPNNYVVASETRQNLEYRVCLYSPSDASCSCQGYRTHRHCKHSREALATLSYVDQRSAEKIVDDIMDRIKGR